MQTQVTLSVT